MDVENEGEAVTLGQIAKAAAQDFAGNKDVDFVYLRPDKVEAYFESIAQAVRAEVLRWKPMSEAPRDRKVEVKYDDWRAAPVTRQHEGLWRTPESGPHKYISEDRCSGWREIK